MRSKNSYRPQNQHPDGLVESRKRLAEQHYQQVRVTMQAMVRRGMKPHEVTVPVVAKEAKVSVATIYRRTDLRGTPRRTLISFFCAITPQVKDKLLRKISRCV